LEILVLTISDRAAAGEYDDLSGPEVERILSEGIEGSLVERMIVSDDREAIENALEGALGKDVIITTGGTGLGPRDNTPEATEAFCDKLIPGISEYLREESRSETLNAVLSRGVAGMKGRTIVVNLPGSVKGAAFCAGLLVHILPHACRMALGGGH
jgi:molybdopterin adenylyltransferase